MGGEWGSQLGITNTGGLRSDFSPTGPVGRGTSGTAKSNALLCPKYPVELENVPKKARNEGPKTTPKSSARKPSDLQKTMKIH